MGRSCNSPPSPCGASTRFRIMAFPDGLSDHVHSTHHTIGSTPLDEWSVRSRDFNLITHNTHKRQTFEPTIPASDRPQTYALDRAATEISEVYAYDYKNYVERKFRSTCPISFAALVCTHIVIQPCGGLRLFLRGTTAHSSPTVHLSFGLVE